MHAEGDRLFALGPADLFARLSDAGWLAHCLHDAQVLRAEPDVAEWKLRPALAFMAGSIESTLTITDRRPATAMRATVQSKGIGATTKVETTLTFTPRGEGSGVHWEMTISELTGLLKLVPKGLLQATASKVIDDVWAQIDLRLAK